ncbi:MAG: Mur ligase family protein [Pseudomonadota bacterium]|nr:Mur ligase family protein [Pseudomonadota bacterium]
MNEMQSYFLVGAGGSGMLPLALILRAKGHMVEGSDRALDQGRTAPKFDYLRAQGIKLHPQDGTGVTSSSQIVVASAAVEDTVPDIVAARRVGARKISRADLLAELFNASPLGVGVAGTSGKSTTTAMIGWILHCAGKDPTVMNGAVMKNFVTPDVLFASALVGGGAPFVSEIDESDGSIAMFSPRIAVLNNISLDHKTMDELRRLFGDFVSKAETAIVNLDNEETARIAARAKKPIAYSLADDAARLLASDIRPERYGVSFSVRDRESGASARVDLKMPGRHNVSNALAAVGASLACAVSLEDAAAALGAFAGVRRRMEVVGEAGGVTVIDDFGHNPDKIAATLRTLHEFPGRLLVMFQPHGYGPLNKMKAEFIDCFARYLYKDDILAMPEPVYFGGTVDRTTSSADIAEGVAARGRKASAFRNRAQCGDFLLNEARTGDRIIVMGARDDTLSTFASELLERIS